MKVNLPEQIWIGKPEYSWHEDWSVNGWLMTAALLSGVCDIMFRNMVRQWSTECRTIIAVLPLVAIVLWSLSLIRWVRGMDELHRRIMTSAITFAVSATFFIVMLWSAISRALVSHAIVPVPGAAGHSGHDITIAHAFLLLTLFYAIGHFTFNRRFV